MGTLSVATRLSVSPSVCRSVLCLSLSQQRKTSITESLDCVCTHSFPMTSVYPDFVILRSDLEVKLIRSMLYSWQCTRIASAATRTCVDDDEDVSVI